MGLGGVGRFANRPYEGVGWVKVLAECSAEEEDEYAAGDDEKGRDNPSDDAHRPVKPSDGVLYFANPLLQLVVPLVVGGWRILLTLRLGRANITCHCFLTW